MTGTCIKILDGHRGKINGLVYDEKERCIVSCSDDTTTRIWGT